MKINDFLSLPFLRRFRQHELVRNLTTPPRLGTELGECSTTRRAFSSPANLRPKPAHNLAGYEMLRVRATSASPEYRPRRQSVIAKIPARFSRMNLVGDKLVGDNLAGDKLVVDKLVGDNDVAADYLVDLVADFMLTYLTAAITSHLSTRDVPPCV